MQKKARSSVKEKGLGYYHFCTDGLKERKLFNSPEEYAFGMTLMGLVTLKYDLVIYAFALMPNHMHIIMKSDGVHALGAFDYLRRKISSRLVADGYPPLLEYDFKFLEIKDKQQMRHEIAYVLRNGYEKGLATPGGYMWSSGWLYFSDMPSLVSGTPVKEIGYKSMRTLTMSHETLPPDWLINNKLGLLPSSYVDTGMVKKVFSDAKDFETALVKDYEAYVKTARSLDETAQFSNVELPDIVSQVLQGRFGGKSLNALSQDEKCRLAVILHTSYDLTSYQISTSIFMKEHLVRQVLNSKDFAPRNY